jgi:outer membrane protein assembly factor BamB
MRHLITGAMAAVLVIGGALVPTTQATATSAGCSSGPAPGGDWPTYGSDLANTRRQPNENTITTLTAPTLAPKWVYNTGNAPQVAGYTDINSTPTVARGCVYIGDAAGDVSALDANTGTLVWKTHIDLPVAQTGLQAGAVVGSVTVDGQKALVAVNKLGGPYVLALNATTGAQLWQSPPLDTQTGAYTNASPTVYNGEVLVGFSAPEGDPAAQGGFSVVDESTGAVLAHTDTISPAHQAAGYAGGGIWSTAAVDTTTGYAYVGSGNPFSKQVEDERTNAILKIDLNRGRPTFGAIVASYKGNIDQYSPLLLGLTQPTCAVLPELPTIPPLPAGVPPVNQLRDNPLCGQQDLDFGASPNLFRAPDGTLSVGELQKSGVYHVVDAATMQGQRRLLIGQACLACNASSTAYDPTANGGTGQVYADVAPGIMVAFDPNPHPRITYADSITVVGDVNHYEPVATAGGVEYTVTSNGFLDARNTQTGLPLLTRSLALDGVSGAIPAAFPSSGVAIANHTVYVAYGSGIAAYRTVL